MASHEPTPASGQIPAINPATGHAREIEAQIIAQAVQNPAFRARVVTDPKTVFAQMGLSIPPEVHIQTVEETVERYYLVLPALGQTGGAEASLSDAQLEAVAGGDATHTATSYDAWTGCASGQSGCIGCPSM